MHWIWIEWENLLGALMSVKCLLATLFPNAISRIYAQFRLAHCPAPLTPHTFYVDMAISQLLVCWNCITLCKQSARAGCDSSFGLPKPKGFSLRKCGACADKPERVCLANSMRYGIKSYYVFLCFIQLSKII